MTLGVELINNRDIVISSPESGFSVTYRKDGDAPMLVAINGIGRVVDQAKVKSGRKPGRQPMKKRAPSAG